MKGIAACVGASLLLLSAQRADAQARATFLVVTGGATLPIGDFGEYAKAGWMGAAGLGYNISTNLFVAATGMYGSNKHSDLEGEKTNLIGAAGTLGYSFASATSKMAPYVRGGLGYLDHQFKTPSLTQSEWKPLVQFGAGVFMPKGAHGWFAEAIYNTRAGTAFLGINLGFTRRLSGRK